jgi:hypothetical protein
MRALTGHAFTRPSGTRSQFGTNPGNKLPGYFQMSRRDAAERAAR